MARPGHYGDYLTEFRRWKLRDLDRELKRLKRYKYGAAWPRANYRLALEKAINERRTQ